MYSSVRWPFYRTLRRVGSIVNNGAEAIHPNRWNFVSLKPSSAARGRVLIAHKADALIRRPDDPFLRTHNHFVEAKLIAEVFLEQGYAVDFIDHRNRWFKPKQRYDIFLGPRINFEILAQRLPSGCIKIVNLDTAHWLYNNAAALRRLQEVHARRHVALSSYTEVKANSAIEIADCATLLGNRFDYDTYAFAGKQIFQLPNPGTTMHPWIEGKDFDACRKRFLWLGSSGLVHKGLDLALDAFSRMPDLHLTVCGPIHRDPQFVNAFHKELYETPNIRTHGWIDVTAPEFASLAQNTLAHIYPTTSDACCGSVINCMHAGLIPVATKEAGIDIANSFGMIISSQSAEAVEAAARTISSHPADNLCAMAKASWHEAQTMYSPTRYKTVLKSVIERIISGHPHDRTPGFVPIDETLASPVNDADLMTGNELQGRG
jgi:glycosyltransferase involved in cell wall biosynthesis